MSVGVFLKACKWIISLRDRDTKGAFTSAQDRATMKIDLSGTDGLAGSVTDQTLRFFCCKEATRAFREATHAPWKTKAINFGGLGAKPPTYFLHHDA